MVFADFASPIFTPAKLQKLYFIPSSTNFLVLCEQKRPKGKCLLGGEGRVSQSSDEEWNGEEGRRRVSLLAVERLLELNPAVQLNQWAWSCLSRKSWHLEPYCSPPPTSHTNPHSHPFILSVTDAKDTVHEQKKASDLMDFHPCDRDRQKTVKPVRDKEEQETEG